MRLLTIGLLCSQLLVATTSAAEEQMHYVHGEAEMRPSTVMRMPQHYSIEHPETIGVFINHFPSAGISAENLAAAIARLFQQEGISVYITSYYVPGVDNRRTEITFFLNGVPHSGYTADNLLDGIAQMVNYQLAEQNMIEIEDGFSSDQ